MNTYSELNPYTTSYDLIEVLGSSDISFKNAFDDGLCKKEIQDVNFIHVSSILPPRRSLRSFRDHLVPGHGYLCACSEIYFFSGEKIPSVGIGVGIPKNNKKTGIIIEIQQDNLTEEILKRSLDEMIANRNEKSLDYTFVYHIIPATTPTDKKRYQYRGCLLVLF